MKLDAEKFDQVIGSGKPEKIWGARAIAAYLGLSEDTIRRWAIDPDIPIYAPRSGTYLAFRPELDAWLRQKPAA